MNKQTIKFVVEKKSNGQIKTIGKSVIRQPKINFSGGSIKWYEDKPKSQES